MGDLIKMKRILKKCKSSIIYLHNYILKTNMSRIWVNVFSQICRIPFVIKICRRITFVPLDLNLTFQSAQPLGFTNNPWMKTIVLDIIIVVSVLIVREEDRWVVEINSRMSIFS